MINRLITLKKLKNSKKIDKDDIGLLNDELNKIINKKGYIIIALIGPPGGGKSTLCRKIISNGFMSFDKNDIIVIDDLATSQKIRYRKTDLRNINRLFNKKLIIISDFRAANYLKNLDLILMLEINEKERLENLRKRHSKKYNLYSKWYFRIPPISVRFLKKNLYIIRDISIFFNQN